MRKYLLHILIISFIFLLAPTAHVASYAGITSDDYIESRIDGEFEGWDGDTIIKLMNGQIWQQTEYYYYYTYSYMPKVIIFKSDYGYKMLVDGVDKAIGVERLK